MPKVDQMPEVVTTRSADASRSKLLDYGRDGGAVRRWARSTFTRDNVASALKTLALAVMPFVKFPTGDDELTNDHVEGGVILPFATELPTDFSLGLMAEFDVVYDDADDDYDVELLHTAALGHDLVGNLAGYVEYIGIAPLHGDADYQALLGAGLTYALGDDVQLDAGVNFGLTDDADDFNVFAGITVRL